MALIPLVMLLIVAARIAASNNPDTPTGSCVAMKCG